MIYVSGYSLHIYNVYSTHVHGGDQEGWRDAGMDLEGCRDGLCVHANIHVCGNFNSELPSQYTFFL